VKVCGRKYAIGVVSLISLFLFGCRDEGALSGAEVICGRYESRGMRPISPRSPTLKTVEAWMMFINNHAQDVGRAAMKCPTVENTPPVGLKYEYHMAWEDSAAGNVVLYYFAPIPKPKGYAGYGIHAVIGIDGKKLKQLCIFPVPLE
jgi:hypothetical protein